MLRDELTVNWHITEACNFKCAYCFAHWDKVCKKELLHNPYEVEKLLDQILLLPELIYDHSGQCFDSVRLNLVGGETFLYPKAVEHIIKEAVRRKFTLSAITNGSNIDNYLSELIGLHFSSIGFSVDSINDKTNLLIGRKIKDEAMQADKILQQIAKIRDNNPNIGIKVNTVVNHLNYNERLHSFIEKARPNKWKVFKMLPITTKKLAISDEQFQVFLYNHLEFSRIISSENNDEMTHSYLMIDPNGRFFQNVNGELSGYVYSEPILKNGIKQAFYQTEFNVIKFKQRYQ